MKKIVCAFLALLVMASCVVMPCFAAVKVDEGYDYTRFKDDKIVLNVYNWGQYISDGSDGSLSVEKEFEDLTGIEVNYTTYDTNESLYSKMKSGGADYDVVIPSDYMIGKMVKEGMLEKLDTKNIPNISKIGKEYMGLDYDKNNEYSVPYTWGVVGIVYNTKMVTKPVDSWNIMWDKDYAGKILMFNNSRDAFSIASKKLGLPMNPKNQEEIDAAAQALKEQKNLVQAYVMDEIFDKMEGGEAAIAFAIPKEGTNYFVDAMCIPKGSKNKQAAEMFINFMCETEIALANNEYIGYSTPQTEAISQLPEELKNNPIAYPAPEVMANTETFTVLSDEI
ncbi:MAG: spermidine/putrescine ABC transporter substrate-binding protein, partial [Oscillospiraceae bacterium]